jgi:hypothetical protein
LSVNWTNSGFIAKPDFTFYTTFYCYDDSSDFSEVFDEAENVHKRSLEKPCDEDFNGMQFGLMQMSLTRS